MTTSATTTAQCPTHGEYDPLVKGSVCPDCLRYRGKTFVITGESGVVSFTTTDQGGDDDFTSTQWKSPDKYRCGCGSMNPCQGAKCKDPDGLWRVY